MFLVPQVSVNLGISPSLKLWYQFSPSSLEMCGFSHFYQILLSLSDVSSAFHDSIWIVYAVWHTFCFNINLNTIMKCAWNVR